MSTGLLSRFEPDRRVVGDGLLSLVISDYIAYYREKNEPARRLALLSLPRVIHNPCLHATILLRLALRSPKFMLGFWRTLLIAKHSIDIQGDIEVGPGLTLPHPIGIVLGWGVRIGSEVTILNNVTIGGAPQRVRDERWMTPVIGDRVTIYTQSIVIGPITVGDDVMIGARSWVDQDVASGEVVTGRPNAAR